jgi:hypothetical protein
VSLRPGVRAGLEGHGLEIGAGDTPRSLRERLNDVYVEEVKALKKRRVAGEIAPRDYAAAVQGLRDRYPLLGLPLSMWEE